MSSPTLKTSGFPAYRQYEAGLQSNATTYNFTHEGRRIVERKGQAVSDESIKCTKCRRELPRVAQCPDCEKPSELASSAGSGKYDEARIAREIWLTARGSHYYGNALYVAMDMPCIVAAPEQRAAIQRYLNGTQTAEDHIRLQEAVRLILTNAEAKKETKL